MKTIAILTGFLFSITMLQAQSYKPKKKKKDFFGGARDYRNLRNFGLQMQIGPTYTFTKSQSDFHLLDDGQNRTSVMQDPSGSLGVYAEIGMAHFNLKKPKYRFIPMIHYYDYGVGFKMLGGKEETTINTLDNTGAVITSTKGNGSFNNGYVTFRAGAHYLKYFKNGSKFLDHSLGFNGDYLVMEGTKSYNNNMVDNQRFSPALRVQMHFDLGFGIRLKRGSYLIPGVQVPIVGIQAAGQESLYWFSNKYYPALFKLKWIFLFEKKGNGCTDNGTEEDKKKNKEYLQNK